MDPSRIPLGWVQPPRRPSWPMLPPSQAAGLAEARRPPAAGCRFFARRQTTPSDPAASPLEPTFDVVNVDPSGEAVIAGRAAPNEKVELRDAGKTVAEATADAAGQFVIIPPALAPGDHSLSLASSADKAQAVDIKSVAVSVAAQEVKVAVCDPLPEPSAQPSGPERRDAHARDADAGDARSGQRRPGRNPIGRGRHRGRPRRQRFGGAQCNRAPLSQSGGPRRGQDAIGRPLVIDDPARHEPGRLCHTGRRDRPGEATVVASAKTPFDYPEAPTSRRRRWPPQAPSRRPRPRQPTR